MTRLWIYKNNARGHKHQLSTGDWERFFEIAKDAPKPWGSSDYIGPANTKAVYTMATGDLVLCWQSDRRSAVGLAEVVEEPSDRDTLRRIIRLRVVQRFATPVSLDSLRTRPALASLAALKSGPVRTIYETNDLEASDLLKACGMSQAKLSAKRSSFGSAQHNAAVEKAAVAFVTKHYRTAGWSIKSRETENIGYDLDATRGTQVRHLEVKGTSGYESRFMLTLNEHHTAETDQRFRLCLVTGAQDKGHETYQEWSAAQLLAQGDFVPLSYIVGMPSP